MSMFTHNRQKITSPLDQYYTREHVVKECVQHIDFNKYDCVIEPSAGGGAFIEHIVHSNIIAMDLKPTHPSVSKGDWLQYHANTSHKSVLVIGNPPFGNNHKLSNAFILHALECQTVQTIGFILPNTYRKHTRQRILPDNWRIVDIIDIGENAFEYDGNICHMPCSFFVFDKSEGVDLRFKISPEMYKQSKHFLFSHPYDSDFFMFGAVPSKIISKPTKNNRGYHIKVMPKVKPDEVIDRIQSINWQGNSCANGGIAWFTKPEIVYWYNQSILNTA